MNLNIIQPWLWPVISLCIAFFLVLMVQPSIARIALVKNISDPEDTEHKGIPQLTLGGIAVFIGITLSSIFCIRGHQFPGLQALISSMVVLLFTGMISDCRVHYQYFRSFSKIIAAIFIVLMGRIAPSVSQLISPKWVSLCLQILAVTGFIYFYHYFTRLRQRYFLISGFINALVFSIFFFCIQKYNFSVISFALLGSLTGTIIYAQYAVRKKKPIARLGHTGIYMIAIVLAMLWLKVADILISGI